MISGTALLTLILFAGMSPVAADAAEPVPPQRLQIVILEGDGAINNIRQRTAREPIVQVEDENHKPVAGAVVFFLSPDQGPGGVFLNDAKSISVTTDAQGKAVARGFRPNTTTGDFGIQVSASFQGQTARTVIHQSNMLLAGVSASTGLVKWLAIVGIAGVVGGGIFGVTQGSGHASSAAPGANPTTITAGPGSVGPPR